MVTPPPVAARRLRTEEKIEQAVRALLGTGGVDAVSMRAIADRSGITPGAIYKHFTDKQALIDHVVETAFEHFELYLLRAITSLPVGSFARLAALGESYIRFAEENEEEFKILFMPLVTGRKQFRDLPGQGGYPILRQCVVEAIDAGTISDEDPDLVALFLWSRVHGIVMLLLACDFEGAIDVGCHLTPLELFNRTRGIVVEGLKPRA